MGMKPYDPERIFTIVLALLAFAAVMSGYWAVAALMLIILIVGLLYLRAIMHYPEE